MNRWRVIEPERVPETQATERAALAALPQRGGSEVVYEANVLTGMTAVKAVTEADPSAESRRLADALAVMGDPEAEPLAPTLWDPDPEETRRLRWLDSLELASEASTITTKEWGRLLEAFGRLGRTRGWLGEDGQQQLNALLRTRLGPSAAPPPPAPGPLEQKAAPIGRAAGDTWAGPASGKDWAGQKYGPGGIEYGQAVPGARVVGRG